MLRIRLDSFRSPALYAGAALLVVAGCGSDPADPGDGPPAECSDANTVTLAPGQSVVRAARDARVFCISSPAGGDYVLVPFAGTAPSTAVVQLQIESEHVLAPAAAAQPAPPAATPGWPEAAGAAHAGDGPDGAHAELRRRELRELVPLVRPGRAAAAPAGPAHPVRTPTVGSLVSYNARADSACAAPYTRAGRVVAVTQRAVVVADTLNPGGGFTEAEYLALGMTFDTLVTPLTTEHFGTATDLDGNERTVLFFTQEVNRLSPPGSGRIVNGFFYARDLFPKVGTDRLQACPASNEAEILYLSVPDPTGSLGNVRQKESVLRASPSTMAHEVQHLVNAARRLHILRSAEPFEAVWLNEALSHTAEELLFFRASRLAPRSNLGAAQIQGAGADAVEAFNAHQLPNVRRLEFYLGEPDGSSLYSEEDTFASRGASQSFLRYAMDRRGQGEVGFLRALVDAPDAGIANLAARVGGEATLRDWLADWAVAIYADERVDGLAPQHRLASWNLASLFQALNIQPYPATTRALGQTASTQVTIQGGGAAYLRFRVGEAERGRVVFTSPSGALPSELRVTLLRTR